MKFDVLCALSATHDDARVGTRRRPSVGRLHAGAEAYDVSNRDVARRRRRCDERVDGRIRAQWLQLEHAERAGRVMNVRARRQKHRVPRQSGAGRGVAGCPEEAVAVSKIPTAFPFNLWPVAKVAAAEAPVVVASQPAVHRVYRRIRHVDAVDVGAVGALADDADRHRHGRRRRRREKWHGPGSALGVAAAHRLLHGFQTPLQSGLRRCRDLGVVRRRPTVRTAQTLKLCEVRAIVRRTRWLRRRRHPRRSQSRRHLRRLRRGEQADDVPAVPVGHDDQLR